MKFTIKVLKNKEYKEYTLINVNKKSLIVDDILNKSNEDISNISLLNELNKLKNEMRSIKLQNSQEQKKYNLEKLELIKIDLPKEKIQKFIAYKSIQGEIKFFKEVYLKNKLINKYSLKYIKGRQFKYWDGDNWILDIGGLYIAEIILKNLQNSYLKINKFKEDKEDNGYDINIFLENQIKIHKLTNLQYKMEFIRSIKDLIKIDE
jgi:hypothetical protein